MKKNIKRGNTNGFGDFENTSEISAATEEQATGIESILSVMENVKTGVDKLSDVFNSNTQKSVS